jgi:hypothetical protein
MLYLNATTCVYAGGDNKNRSDYNQLTIRRPSTDYSLDQSQDCKTAVKVSRAGLQDRIEICSDSYRESSNSVSSPINFMAVAGMEMMDYRLN